MRTFEHINVRRYVDRDKQNVIKLFERTLQPKLKQILPFSDLTEPVFYMIHIRSSKGLLSTFSYYLQRTFDGDSKKAVISSLAVEILSACVLILDDIFDKDEERSGVPSVWKKYGMRNALISVFFSQDLTFRKIRMIDPEIEKVIREAWSNALKFFKLEEEFNEKVPSLSELKRLAILFTSFSRAVVDLVKVNSNIREKAYSNLLAYNKELSIAWYFSNSMEIFSHKKDKKVYSDIINKYNTLPIVILRERMQDKDLEFFNRIFGKPEHVKDVLSLMKKYKVPEICNQIISQHYKRAMSFLKNFWEELKTEDETLRTILKCYSRLPLSKLQCDFL